MVKKPTLASAMTPFPYAVPKSATIEEADTLMRKHAIHHLPVTEEREIIGLLSAFDIASRAHKPGLVGDFFTPEPFVVDIDTPLESVLFEMADHRLEAAVVTRHGRLAGIFTQVDACRTFAAHLNAAYPPSPEDLVA